MIKLETNGKASSTKQTRHINIQYFLVTDRIKHRDITSVKYCPTGKMIADYFTKPLLGSLFRKFRNAIMGCTDAEYLAYISMTLISVCNLLRSYNPSENQGVSQGMTRLETRAHAWYCKISSDIRNIRFFNIFSEQFSSESTNQRRIFRRIGQSQH